MAATAAPQANAWQRPLVARVRRRTPPRSQRREGPPERVADLPSVTRSQKHTMRAVSRIAVGQVGALVGTRTPTHPTPAGAGYGRSSSRSVR